jgi:hypothetical protein
MMRLTRAVLIAGAVIGAAGCASSPSPGATTTAEGAGARPRRDPNVITGEELASRSTLNARQAIEQLRPQFLRTRGTTTLGNASVGDVIWVYVDGTRMGDLSVLNNITVPEIREIRYLSPSEATNRWGTGHVQGAILITRR